MKSLAAVAVCLLGTPRDAFCQENLGVQDLYFTSFDLGFSEDEKLGETIINLPLREVIIRVRPGTDLTELVAEFTFNQRAFARVDGVVQDSGITSHGYLNPVEYELTGLLEPVTTVWVVEVLVSSFSLASTPSISPARGSTPSWVDFDGDGLVDLVAVGIPVGGGNPVPWVHLNVAGELGTRQGISITDPFTTLTLWGDYNVDTVSDVLVVGEDDRRAFIKLYRGAGGPAPGFVEVPSVFTAVSNAQGQWVDHNGDLKPDLMLTGKTDNGIRVATLYDNRGARGFEENTKLVIGMSSVLSTDWGDYDRDGIQDLVVGGYHNGVSQARVFKGMGKGSYHPDFDVFPLPIEDISVEWGDLDGDEDLDILVTGKGEGSLAWLAIESEAGRFEVGDRTVLSTFRLGSFLWMDSDTDGDVDLWVCGERSESGLSTFWYANDAEGVFELADKSLPGLAECRISGVDVDGDRDTDVLISGMDYNGNDRAFLFRNEVGVFNFPSVEISGPSSNVRDELGEVTLQWAAAPYAVGGSSMSLFHQVVAVGNASADELSGWLAATGKIPFSPAATTQGSQVTLNSLTGGEYSWRVLTFNANAEQLGASPPSTFLVNNIPPSDIHLSSLEIPESSSGTITIGSLSVVDVNGDDHVFSIVSPLMEGGRSVFFLEGTLLKTSKSFDAATRSTYTVSVSVSDGHTGGVFVKAFDLFVVPVFEMFRLVDSGGMPLEDVAVDVLSRQITVTAGSNLSPGPMVAHFQVSSPDAQVRVSGITQTSGADSHDFLQPVVYEVEVTTAGGVVGYSWQVRVAIEYPFSFAAIPSPTVWSTLVGADLDMDRRMEFIHSGLTQAGSLLRPSSFLVDRSADRTEVTELEESLGGLLNGDGDWGDYDRDGDLDFVAMGDHPSQGKKSFLFRNDQGRLTSVATTLPGFCCGSVRWGDVDNDGHLDLLYSGINSRGVPQVTVLMDQGPGVYKAPIFSVSYPGVSGGNAEWADFDRDGDLDVLVAGTAVPGDPATSSVRLFQNMGDPSLVEIGVDFVQAHPLRVLWGDSNLDGYPDILVGGTMSDGRSTVRIYENVGGSSFVEKEIFTSHAIPLLVETLNWVDLGGDERLDITFLAGHPAATHFHVYHNDGLGGYVAANPVVVSDGSGGDPVGIGILEGKMRFADADGDGDADLLFTGIRDFQLQAGLLINNTPYAGQRPPAPVTMEAVVDAEGGRAVTLTWGPGPPDDRTPAEGISYEIYLARATGEQVPATSLGDGTRMVIRSGQILVPEYFSVTLSRGEYFWSVQAVDGAFLRSPYAEEKDFTISNAPPILIQLCVRGVCQASQNVLENSPAPTLVGTFGVLDMDRYDNHEFVFDDTVVPNDNAMFTIRGNELWLNDEVDFEDSPGPFTVTVTATDPAGASASSVLLVAVIDVPELLGAKLEPATLEENNQVGARVGDLFARHNLRDPEFEFTLVVRQSGGYVEPDEFHEFGINGIEVYANKVFDYETENTFQIWVRIDESSESQSWWTRFTINILDVNEPPTELNLSNNTVKEGLAARTIVGEFSTVDPDEVTYPVYSLVGDSPGNAEFSIEEGVLLTGRVLYHDSDPSLSIGVRVDDSFGGSFETTFTIEVLTSTDLSRLIELSGNTIVEGRPAGTLIGLFSTILPGNIQGQFEYSLVDGIGDSGNGNFRIEGDRLLSSTIFDYNTLKRFSIRVRSSDPVRGYEERVFSIAVLAAVPPLPVFLLSPGTIEEGSPVDSFVGTIGGQVGNPDVSYRYAVWTEDPQSLRFHFEGNGLYTSEIFDFEGEESITITVQITGENGAVYYKDFVIVVTDVVEFNVFPNPTSGELTITTDASAGIILRVFDVSGKYLHYRILSGATQYQLDLHPWRAGVYLFEVEDSSRGVHLYKIVKY